MQMNKKKILNTVFKKYAFGYILMGLSLIFFLGTSMLASTYIARQYRNATERMIQINDLHNAVNDLSEDINMAYSFLSMDGIDQYPQMKSDVEHHLENTRLQLNEKYIRELADLNSIIETYICRSDLLIADIESYIQNSKNISHDKLSGEYDYVQEAYSYVGDCFQNVYSAKYGQLSSTENALKHVQQTINLFLIVFILVIVVVCALYLVAMIKDVIYSIKTLQSGVNSMEENIAEAKPITLKSSDEFENLADAYNSMLGIIQTQMQKIAQDADMKERLSEAEKKNLQIYSDLQKNNLDFLQSRINPHFLFNTLNMISAQTRLEHAEKSAELIELTASYLRYNLDNIKKTVTLEKEVQNLKDYIAIQEYRYGERFSYELLVNCNCLDQSIPCMVLQPLVENSIQHGIGMMVKGGVIRVSAYREDERVILEIMDNGIGASQERIDEIVRNLKENTSSSTHIGIRNIYQRLRLYYKDDIMLTMKNADPGLVITISLPYIRNSQL